MLLDLGLNICVNSDDPAYFGDYVNETFQKVHEGLNIGKNNIECLVVNSLRLSLLSEQVKDGFLKDVDAYVSQAKYKPGRSVYASLIPGR